MWIIIVHECLTSKWYLIKMLTDSVTYQRSIVCKSAFFLRGSLFRINSVSVQFQSPRPERQIRMAVGLHWQRSGGVHLGRWNREEPPRPNAELCEYITRTADLGWSIKSSYSNFGWCCFPRTQMLATTWMMVTQILNPDTHSLMITGKTLIKKLFSYSFFFLLYLIMNFSNPPK